MIVHSRLGTVRNGVPIGAGNRLEDIAVHTHVEGEHLAVCTFVTVAHITALLNRNG